MQYTIIFFQKSRENNFFWKKILKENNHTEAMSV